MRSLLRPLAQQLPHPVASPQNHHLHVVMPAGRVRAGCDLAKPDIPRPAGAPFQGAELGLFQDVPWWTWRKPIWVPDIATMLACERESSDKKRQEGKVFDLKRTAVKTIDFAYRITNLKLGSSICYCVTLSMSLSYSALICKSGHHNTYFLSYLWRLNEAIHIECLTQYLAQSKHSVSGGLYHKQLQPFIRHSFSQDLSYICYILHTIIYTIHYNPCSYKYILACKYLHLLCHL